MKLIVIEKNKSRKMKGTLMSLPLDYKNLLLIRMLKKKGLGRS